MLKKVTPKKKKTLLMADPASCHQALCDCHLLCSFACILHKKRENVKCAYIIHADCVTWWITIER